MSIRHYHRDEIMDKQKYMKIYLLSQAYVPEVRKLFEEGSKIRNSFFLPRQTF